MTPLTVWGTLRRKVGEVVARYGHGTLDVRAPTGRCTVREFDDGRARARDRADPHSRKPLRCSKAC